MTSFKISFLALLFTVASFSVFAQSSKSTTPFSKGQIELSAGVGVGMTTIVNGIGMITPPVNINLEYGITNRISIGAFAAYGANDVFVPQWQIDSNSAIDEPLVAEKEQHYSYGGRIAVHFINFEKWDVYGGSAIGMKKSKVSPLVNTTTTENVTAEETTSFLFSGMVGAKYYPVRNLGFYGELGLGNGISIFNVGVSLKI